MEQIYKKKRRQRNLIIVFLISSLVTFSVLYFGFFKKEKPVRVLPPEVITPEGVPSPGVVVKEKKVAIDFSIFENPLLKELQPFEKIESPKPEDVGRENPFSPIE
jgi:hypothetical protein